VSGSGFGPKGGGGLPFGHDRCEVRGLGGLAGGPGWPPWRHVCSKRSPGHPRRGSLHGACPGPGSLQRGVSRCDFPAPVI
jgi:hypothetical protein